MQIQVSTGELLDKLTILEIKRDTIKDENRLIEVKKELDILLEYANIKEENRLYYNILKWINKKIWSFTDTIKTKNYLDSDFALISNNIFNFNQYRFRTKNMLNSKSVIKEQKSYPTEKLFIRVDFISFYSNLTKINKLSIMYDMIIFCSKDDTLLKYISSIYTTSNFSVSNECLEESISFDEISIDDNIDNDNIFTFDTINYVASGLMGDFIHQLSVCNEIFINTGKKANLYISNNWETFKFDLQTTYKDLKTFMDMQSYINYFGIYNDEIININLSSWRFSELLYYNNWHEIFSKCYNVDWCKNNWINCEPKDVYKDIILLNISINRYIYYDYKILKNLKREVKFICFEKSQYENFQNQAGISLDCILVNNILEMCEAISGCYHFIGNLSSPLAMAIGLHKYSTGLINQTIDSNHYNNMKIPNFNPCRTEEEFIKSILQF